MVVACSAMRRELLNAAGGLRRLALEHIMQVVGPAEFIPVRHVVTTADRATVDAAIFGPTSSALCVPARLAASRPGSRSQPRRRKKPAQAKTDDGPQQAAFVVARSTAQRMQCVAQRPSRFAVCTLQPAPIRPVIESRTADQRLDRRGAACKPPQPDRQPACTAVCAAVRESPHPESGQR